MQRSMRTTTTLASPSSIASLTGCLNSWKASTRQVMLPWPILYAFLVCRTKRTYLTRNIQFKTYSFDKIHSHAGYRADLFRRPLDKTLITDFFGAVSRVEVNDAFSEEMALPIHLPSISDARSNGTDETVVASDAIPHEDETSSLLKKSAYPDQQKALTPTWKKQLRAWTSLGIVGALIGGVVTFSR